MSKTLKEREVANPPKPGSEAWQQIITASKIPAITGASPWQSAYALWHEMHGDIQPATPDAGTRDMFAWGHCAEAAMREWWLYQHPGYRVSKKERAYTDRRLPFPNLVTLDRVASRGRAGYRILEFKTTRNIKTWGYPKNLDEPNLEAIPLHYQQQVVFQMGVTGIHEADVVVQAIGEPETFHIQWDDELAGMWLGLKTLALGWWDSLAAGIEPEIDGSPAAADAVKRLNPDVEDRTVVITDELANMYLESQQRKKTVTEQAKLTANQLLQVMGTAKTATLADGTPVATRQARRNGVALVAAKQGVR